MDIKQVIINMNNLCMDLKDIYYNFGESTIPDYEYDKFEDKLKFLLAVSKIDISKDVKDEAVKTVGCSPIVKHDNNFDLKLFKRESFDKYIKYRTEADKAIEYYKKEMLKELKSLMKKYQIRESSKEAKNLTKVIGNEILSK